MNDEPPLPSSEDPVRDARWLSEIAAGGASRPAALKALSQAYNPAFLRFLVRKGLGYDEAEVAMEKTWVRVARRAASYDPRKGTPAALIWTILKGEAAREYRAQQNVPDRFSLDVVDQGEGVPDNPDVPMWVRPAEIDVLLRRCIQNAMAKLWREDPDGAELLWLRSVEEWKPAELAAVDGRTVGTISTLLWAVRKAAARLLKRCHEGRDTPP